MLTRLAASAVPFLAIALVSAQAQADDKPPPIWGRQLSVGLMYDFWPLLMVGYGPAAVAVEVAPNRWTSFEVAGGGYIGSEPIGFAMVHLQAPFWRFSLGAEAGFFITPFLASPFENDTGVGFGASASFAPHGTLLRPAEWATARQGIRTVFGESYYSSAVFTRLGATFAYRIESGHFQVRLHGGAMKLANPNDASCALASHGADRFYGGCPKSMDWVPYLGHEFAYVFNL